MKRIGCMVLVVLLARVAFCQFETAGVVGTVFDAQEAVVPGCQITLKNIDTGVTASVLSDPRGNYQFFNVKVGTYQVTASTSGFRDARADNVVVVVNTRQRVDFHLQVAAAGTRVEVTSAEALLVEAETSARGQVVQSKQIIELPLNGRHYADLTLLSPGAVASDVPTYREGAYFINGLPGALNGFQLDGVDNTAYQTANRGFSNQTIQLTPDAAAEFRVQTNNMSAEYGSVGGGVINATMKSGTNELHGAAWEFVRNTVLNAEGFFHPSSGVKPTLLRNQFGLNFGGPIRRNSLFYFLNFEGFREVTSGGPSFITIPPMDMRKGIMGTPIKDPFTGQIYTDGVIPANRLTPFASKVLGDLPAPLRPGISNNLDLLPISRNYNNKYDAKVDYIKSKMTTFVRISQRKETRLNPSTVPGPSGGSGTNDLALNQQLAAAFTYVPTPRSLLEVRLGISRSHAGTFPLLLGGGDTMRTKYGVNGLPEDPAVAGGLNTQRIGGWSPLGRSSNYPQFQNFMLYQPRVTYSHIVNRHTLKAGYDYSAINQAVLDVDAFYGISSYSGQFSKPPGGTGNAAVYNLADFLLGAQSQWKLGSYAVGNQRMRWHFAYLQDDFKVSPKLTLNLGFRYEFATPIYERDNRMSNFDPTTNSMIQASSGSLANRALVKPDRNDFAPRVGFAYSVNPRTVIRAGYGISYIHFWRQGSRDTLITNVPWYTYYTVDQVPSDPNFRKTQDGYPPDFLNQTPDMRLIQVRYKPTNQPSAYVQSWFFSVQRQLSSNTVLDLAYVGNHALKLEMFGDFNQARPNNPGESLGISARRPIQNFANMTTAFPVGFSTHNALQAKVEHRYSSGVYLINSFTWSKTLASGTLGNEAMFGNGSASGPQDIHNMASEKGLSPQHRKFNNISSVIWEIPVGKGRRFLADTNRFANAAVGGWQVSVLNSMRSGQPFTPRYSPSAIFNVSGYSFLRPNLIGDPLVPKGERRWDNYLNPKTVVLPTDPSHPFGNAGNGIGVGYAFYQLDFALMKSFQMPFVKRESAKVQFRAEAFNLFNKTNWNFLRTDRAFSSFGVYVMYPGYSADPRQLQFGVKLYW